MSPRQKNVELVPGTKSVSRAFVSVVSVPNAVKSTERQIVHRSTFVHYRSGLATYVSSSDQMRRLAAATMPAVLAFVVADIAPSAVPSTPIKTVMDNFVHRRWQRTTAVPISVTLAVSVPATLPAKQTNVILDSVLTATAPALDAAAQSTVN